MSVGQDTAAERPAGLRARKKQRTRDDLMRAALELFTTQGYEATTVDEIADAVEVSQRTFFRYFASKEDVAFGVASLMEGQFVEQLRLRPAGEDPILAMRRAVACAWELMGETIEEVAPVELVMRAYRMIESTPALLSAALRRGSETEDEIVGIIAAREHLDVESDPRPRVAVAAVCGVMRMAGRVWGQPGHETSVEALAALTETYLDALTPSLTGPWLGAREPRTGRRVCRDDVPVG
ncbi:TetR family transcriptional regulator [Streptomyces montanisoli]|uniref:TetR family transcriptional regulator n=1 Tax=Streptomyces montanisoli TaxID=2798581 RepID=A0A940RY72_9ACTN|nr:TetR family transcriptional regulator [Streptomyces montanisoli]MBP0458364.1 TetR family transcriptional regulator [Streptomyces montanisoli]